MHNSPTNRYTPPTSANAYSPSVPISVYRELAAELQTAQAMLDSLNAQNQQLIGQNQQLREEVARVLQSAQHLQQVLDSFTPANGVEPPRSRPSIQPEPRPVAPPPPPRSASSIPTVEFPPPQESEPTAPPYRETLFIEEEDSRPRRTQSSESITDINGWMLVFAILLIVLTAFGTGFLIVRPLLNNNNR